jgi:hypothetical protein
MSRQFIFQNLFVSIYAIVLTTFFISCGSRDDQAGISTPTSLSNFSSFQTIGNPSNFVNFTGSTSGAMSKQPFTDSINGSSVGVTISGTFSYAPQPSGGAKLIFFSQLVTFGGLNDSEIESVVTLDAASELITTALPETEVYELEFSPSPFSKRNFGDLRAIDHQSRQFSVYKHRNFPIQYGINF